MSYLADVEMPQKQEPELDDLELREEDRDWETNKFYWINFKL